MKNQLFRSFVRPIGHWVLCGLLFLLPALAVMTTPRPVQAVAPCSVNYVIVNQWNTGFQANVTITNNTPTTIQGWNLTWTFGSGQGFSSGWNATFAPSGSNMTASNPAGHWNGTLGANGGTATFGFQGTFNGSGAVTVPTNFAVNGTSCIDGVPPTVSPTILPTLPPTTVPTTVPTVIPTVQTSPTPSSGICMVNYVIVNQWGTGFQANVTVVNNSNTAIQGWTLNWSLPSGQQFASGWNATITASGSAITASNPAGHWNGNLAANGGTATFGFQANTSGSLAVPTFFVLNGVTCGGDAPPPTPTINPTIVPTGIPSITPTTPPTIVPTTPPTIVPTVIPPTPIPGTHVQNPFAGATGYLNPDYTAKVMAQANATGGELGQQMALVANYPSAVWMDRIGAIAGSPTAMSLEDHLDEALAQQVGNTPITIMVVIYDLPNRDCSSTASNGELRIAQNGLNRYKTEYIDAIYNVMVQPRFKDLRIVTIIEPDSLPNLITNLNKPDCAEAQSSGAYVQGIQYAINKLTQMDNVYIYLDIAHSGWLGWDSNFTPAVNLYTQVVQATTEGLSSIDGFISNTANYTPVTEPFLPNSSASVPGGNMPIRSANIYEWNPYLSELGFVTALREAFIAKGFPAGVGMLIDTSRNGWGGDNRPTAVSTSTVLNTYVDQSRIDRRPHRGGWCNQAGAGIGERPTVSPAPGVDAYVWIKPPGESDGVSSAGVIDPDDPAKRFDRMCDPTATSVYNNAYPTNALPGAPHAGRWFAEQFEMLVENAYPPLGD